MAAVSESLTPDTFEVSVDRVAKGGAALGPGPDGRVVFVTGAIPGERVLAEERKRSKRFVEARTLHVIEPSPARVEPPCPHVAADCGGCDWQHMAVGRQTELRLDVVRDSLRRLAKIEDVGVVSGPALPAVDYRTILRTAVVDGRAGYRKSRSHDVVAVDSCVVAHPLAEELVVEGRYGEAAEVTIKVGARTGERMVVVPAGVDVSVPDDVVVARRDELAAGREAFIHEEVGGGQRFRISADSFFQCRPDGAEALVAAARSALEHFDGRLLDAYSGVGLFGALLSEDRPLLAVESSQSSVADARVNLAGIGDVVRSRFERWAPVPVAAAVADPARRGLGADGVAVLVATEAMVVALVSCDPASLARDARLLIDAGYALQMVTVIDLFGQTSHVETVSRFVKAS